MAMPAPGFAAEAPSPTLWTMRRACQGLSSRGCSVSAVARQVGNDLRVLVVRMGGDVERAAHGGEAAQRL